VGKQTWEVRYTEEFEAWLKSLPTLQADAVLRLLLVLRLQGPSLGRPYVDTIKGSRYPSLKELRIQSKGKPIRAFFIFDPERVAVILCGGDKTGDEQFYLREIARAEALYDAYLLARKKKP
jgi:hypothetical protein